jgi:epoxyqueuosine reductase QueG
MPHSDNGDYAKQLKQILESALKAASVAVYGFIEDSALRRICAGLPETIKAKYGLENARGAVAAALPYSDGIVEMPEWASSFSGPRALIARFARADWYGELRSRLKAASVAARQSLFEAGIEPGDARDWRCLANSGLPERRLALEAGLGRLGRQGLVMVPGHGSAVVLGIMLITLPINDTYTEHDSNSQPPAKLCPQPQPPAKLCPQPAKIDSVLHELCPSCGACVAACPTGALGIAEPRGSDSFEHAIVFHRERCLQNWSAIPGPLPPEIERSWGQSLYGCDRCQELCPLFRPDPTAQTERGRLGPSLPALWFIQASPAEIKERLRGSVLGRNWIPPEALVRNARLVMKHAGSRSEI